MSECLCFKFRIIQICSVLATPVCLVMDRVAKRPRGFAFLSYTGEEEARGAMEGMHGKFLDGRVIFVEVAKRRAEV